MKKTLFVLAMLAAPAFAEDVVDSLEALYGTQTYWKLDMNTGNMNPSGQRTDWNGTNLLTGRQTLVGGHKVAIYDVQNTASGLLQFPNTSPNADMSAFSDGDWSFSMTIDTLSGDLKDYGAKYFASFLTVSGMNDFGSSAAIAMNDKGELYFMTQTMANEGGFGGSAPTNVLLGTFSQLEDQYNLFKITLVSNTTENILGVYVNDELIQSVEGWNPNNEALGQIALFGDTTQDNRSPEANVSVTDISVWDKAVTYVDPSIPSVPEPATASLSLFGLAALLMRRRRHA